MTYTDYAWNLSVVGGFEKTNAETESLYRQLLEMDGIRDGMYHFSLMLYCDADVYGTPYAQEQLANLTWSDPYGNVHQADHQMQTELVLVSREYFARYLEELGIDETPEKAAVLVDDTIAVGYEKEGVRSIQHFYRTDEGETVRYQFSPREDIADGAQSHEKEIRITARTDRRPMGFENYYSDGSFLFVSEDYENGWFLTDGVAVSGTLYLDAADANETEAAIMEWRSRDPALYWVSVQNIEKSADQDRRFILVLEIFLYGFIAVITLIGVTNIFNTISTNMLLRSREFAMLKSIGMTKKEFGRMVRLESLMYGVKSLVIGALTGIAGSVILYALLADSVDLGYRFPLVPILISAAAVFLIVGGTMWYSTAKINRQNIVETIRRETF